MVGTPDQQKENSLTLILLMVLFALLLSWLASGADAALVVEQPAEESAHVLSGILRGLAWVIIWMCFIYLMKELVSSDHHEKEEPNAIGEE